VVLLDLIGCDTPDALTTPGEPGSFASFLRMRVMDVASFVAGAWYRPADRFAVLRRFDITLKVFVDAPGDEQQGRWKSELLKVGTETRPELVSPSPVWFEEVLRKVIGTNGEKQMEH